jgi:VIT1/CCC1 family predicted Fe2+/Mn2+ transporter
MPKRILSLAIIGLLLNLICYSSVAANSIPKEDEFAAKVKAAIAKIGFGSDARIEVRLRDKTKLKGYVSEANENGFVVVNEKTGIATQVAYPQVKKVKGNNLSSGVKFAIGAAVVVVLLLILFHGNHDL